MFSIIVVVTLGGCRLHCQQPARTCSPYVSQRSDFAPLTTSSASGVRADYSAIDSNVAGRWDRLAGFNTDPTTPIGFEDCLSAAARNSQLADLIDAERHAIVCRVGDCNAPVLNVLLRGAADEQRNKTAGAAGKLFLQLVAVNLQREVLEDSKQHFDELAKTIDGAREGGFATADLETSLEVGREQMQAAEAKLNSSEELLTLKLNALIRPDSESLLAFCPVYDLRPTRLALDPETEIQVAEANRPELVALAAAQAHGISPDAMLKLLQEFDPRLGRDTGLPAIKRRLILCSLRKQMKQQNASPDSANTRQQQLQRIIDGKKSQVRLEVREAFINISAALEKIAIANQTIDRLDSRSQQLKAKQELDAREAFQQRNANWIELQTAKSDRIIAAIEYDSAVLELLVAQGMLIPCP